MNILDGNLLEFFNGIAFPVLRNVMDWVWMYDSNKLSQHRTVLDLCNDSLSQLRNDNTSIDMEELILQGANILISWLDIIPVDIIQALFITHQQKLFMGQIYLKNPQTYIRDIIKYAMGKLKTIIHNIPHGSRQQFVQNIDISGDLAHLYERYEEKNAKHYMKEICTSLISFWKYGGDDLTKIFACLAEWKQFAINEPNISSVFAEDCSSSQELHRKLSTTNNNNNILHLMKQVIENIISYDSIESMKFWLFWLSQISTLVKDLDGLTDNNVNQYKDILATIFSNWGRYLSQMDLKFLGGASSPVKNDNVDENIPPVISISQTILTGLKELKRKGESHSAMGRYVLDLFHLIVCDLKDEDVEHFYGKMFNVKYAQVVHAKMSVIWQQSISEYYKTKEDGDINWEDFFEQFSKYILEIISCLDTTLSYNDFWVFWNNHLKYILENKESGERVKQLCYDIIGNVEILQNLVQNGALCRDHNHIDSYSNDLPRDLMPYKFAEPDPVHIRDDPIEKYKLTLPIPDAKRIKYQY